MKQENQIDPTILEGEVVYDVATNPIITADDLVRVDEFMDKLHELCVRLGIPPTGTIVDGSIAQPVTNPTRLLDGGKDE